MEEERFVISVNQEDVQNIINAYEKDLKYIKQLEQERNNYKELYEKEQEKIDKAYSWITLMLMDNDVSKEKALITIKNILGGSNE